MNVSMTIKKLGIEQAFKYLYKEPEKMPISGNAPCWRRYRTFPEASM